MKKALLILIISISFLKLFGQNEINLSELACRTQIEVENILFLEDTTNQLTFENIKNENFEEVDNLKNLQAGNTYWVKIKFKNPENKDKTIILDFFEITHIYVYYNDEKKEVVENITGWYNAKNSNQLILGSKFYTKIEVYENSTQTIYLKLRNEYDIPPRIQIFASPLNLYLKNVFFETFFHGIFQGLLWMLVIFGLFYIFIIKDKSYSFFVAFMLLFSIYFLNHYRIIYLIFGTIGTGSTFLYWLIFPSLLLYMNFSRIFLNLKEEMPKLNSIFIKTIMIGTLAAIVSFVCIFFSYKAYMHIFQAYIVFYALVYGLLIFAGFHIKNKISGYYLKGSFFFFIGGFLAMLGVLNVIELNLIYLEAGLIGQFFFFTIGLQHKNQQEREKAQAEIIEQLEENRELQTKVNRELEEKVRERTKEIKAQNEEILVQSERLHNANAEIIAQRDDIQEKSNLLETRNKQITDSIKYASRIQNAILGDIDEIISKFRDAFIFFKPHSIVSGDFYWYAQVHNWKIIIAADCTGHGVPGAFMTVMGNDFLEDIVKINKTIEPNVILRKLDFKIRERLMNEASNEQIDDGMDIAILAINENVNRVLYAGARNPLYYVSLGKMNVIKASKNTVGGDNLYSDDDKVFDIVDINYKKGDKFYIFSDGFQDQFGGQDNSKFMARKFRELLLENSTEPMKDQKEILNATFLNWKRDREQTDDILVIGVEV